MTKEKTTKDLIKETDKITNETDANEEANKDFKRKNREVKVWKIATWNIRSIAGKEHELINEFEQANLDILTIYETKKKCKGQIELEGGHLLVYSGVNQESRAKEGVGCIIHREYIKYMKKWDYVSERILKIEMQLNPKEKTTLVATYGPSEDAGVGKKDEFWEQLSDVIENVTGRVMVLGDLNSRVGSKNNETIDVMGKYGEEHRNNNGHRLIHFRTDNNLQIAHLLQK